MSGAVLPRTIALASALCLWACTEYGVPAGPGPHYELNFLDMGDQPKIKAQRGDPAGGPELGPAEATIPLGFDPYPYRGRPEEAERLLVNPVAPEAATLARGKVLYERYCVPCHGELGAGDGTVVKKGFPAPPSLMTGKLRQWKDGRIYHVISEGQNIMPSYASQARPEDRWAIIHHLRKLQSGQPVAPPAPGAAATASAAPPTSAAPAASASAAPAPPEGR